MTPPITPNPDAVAAIKETLAIYERLRVANGGTDTITSQVVEPLQEFEKSLEKKEAV